MYHSSNGTAQDGLLQRLGVTGASTGSHTTSFSPDFIDIPQDYFLVASGPGDTSPTVFSGGVFKAADNTAYIFGTSSADTVSISDSGSPSVTYNGGSAVSFSSSAQIHVRTEGGGDTIDASGVTISGRTVWAFGGDGNDTITGGAGNDLLVWRRG